MFDSFDKSENGCFIGLCFQRVCQRYDKVFLGKDNLIESQSILKKKSNRIVWDIEKKEKEETMNYLVLKEVRTYNRKITDTAKMMGSKKSSECVIVKEITWFQNEISQLFVQD